jgi:hypothetical protein
MWRIGRAPNNTSKWQMGFKSMFKWLNLLIPSLTPGWFRQVKTIWYIQQDYVGMIVTLHEIYDISSTICTVMFPHIINTTPEDQHITLR